MPTTAIIATALHTPAAHPFNLEIAGEDVIDLVDLGSIRISLPSSTTHGGMSFTIADPTATVAINEWVEVRFIEHAASRPVVFGGYVIGWNIRVWASGGRSITVECVGYGAAVLDRRVIASLSTTTWSVDGIGAYVQILAGHVGVPAAGYRPGASTTFSGDVDKTVFVHSDWIDSVPVDSVPIAASTLGAALRRWTDTGSDGSVTVDPGYPQPAIPAIFWVDSYRRLVAMWDKPSVATGFIGGAPYTVSDAATGAQAPFLDLDLRVEASGLVTSVYVDGAAPAGTGWVRTAPPAAGDLEVVVADPESDTAVTLAQRGGVELGRSAGTVLQIGRYTQQLSYSITGVVRVRRQGDWRPGQKLSLRSVQALGTTATQSFRITGTTIAFTAGSGERIYDIEFGGALAPPSAAHSVRVLQRSK